MAKSDCLICLFPANGRYRPPLDCDCRPVVHRACWEKWAAFSGNICLICRFNPTPPLPPQPQEQIIYVYHHHQLLGFQRFLYFICVIFTLLTLALFTHRTPMLSIDRGAEL